MAPKWTDYAILLPIMAAPHELLSPAVQYARNVEQLVRGLGDLEKGAVSIAAINPQEYSYAEIIRQIDRMNFDISEDRLPTNVVYLRSDWTETQIEEAQHDAFGLVEKTPHHVLVCGPEKPGQMTNDDLVMRMDEYARTHQKSMALVVFVPGWQLQ